MQQHTPCVSPFYIPIELKNTNPFGIFEGKRYKFLVLEILKSEQILKRINW